VELRPEDIAEIVRIFNDSELVELRLEIGANRLYLSKQAGVGSPTWEVPPAPTAPAASSPAASSPAGASPAAANAPAPPAPTTAVPAEATASAPDASDADAAGPATTAAANLIDLKSPLLGVFYRRPAPDKPAFVEIGSEVGADDPVCIIDVMKMFSRVPAGVAGRVAEILVEDGQLVEHGQVLMRLEPR
jgi:acetyl-CoA carboxylase biotin carboxyl carrier protein